MIPIHMTIDHEHECSVQMRSHATQNICIICVRCSCQPCECLTCGMPSISKKSSRGCFSLWCLMARVLGQASVMKNIDWILIVRSIMLVISVVDAMFFVLCSHTFIIWTIFFLYRFFFCCRSVCVSVLIDSACCECTLCSVLISIFILFSLAARLIIII